MKKQFNASKVLEFISGKREVADDEVVPVIHELGELARTGRFDVEGELCRLKQRIRRRRLLRLYISAAAAVCSLIIGISLLYPTALPTPGNGEQIQVASVEKQSFSGEVELLMGGKEKVNLPSGGTSVVKEGGDVAVVEEGGACLSFKEEKGEESPVAAEEEYNVLRIPRKVNYKLELPDGSQVYLNAETELVFPSRFTGDSRKVSLKSGEAYFEIAKNPEKPFYVEVNGVELQVLGTSFNVNCYTENVATTLVEGSLLVKNKEKKVVLVPGEQAVVESEGIRVSEVDKSLYTAWKEGVFVFRRLDLESILKVMQRWYDFEYVFKDVALKEKIFTGAIDKNKDKEEAFKAICKTVGIRITESDNCVFIE